MEYGSGVDSNTSYWDKCINREGDFYMKVWVCAFNAV
jgi:hypothetical protein